MDSTSSTDSTDAGTPAPTGSRWSAKVEPAALTRAVLDLLTVRRVFGEAYERDGVRVIPVAKVLGGAGSGYGSEDGGKKRRDEGGGGGFGVRVRPVGVYVMDDQGVHWRPAVDVNRIVLGGQLAGMVAVLALSRALRRRRRR